MFGYLKIIFSLSFPSVCERGGKFLCEFLLPSKLVLQPGVVPCHRYASTTAVTQHNRPTLPPSLLPPCPPAWQRQLSNNILQSENNKNSNGATELKHYAMVEGLQSGNLGRGVGNMIDLIQFLDNIRDQTVTWSDPTQFVWSGDVCLLPPSLPPSLTVWYCRL